MCGIAGIVGARRLGPGDADRARTLFALLMKQWRGYASFTLIDPFGRLLASLPAPRAGLCRLRSSALGSSLF